MIPPKQRVLRPEHAEHLARFCIQPDILEGAGVRSVTDNETRELFGVNGYRGCDLSGILFPTFDPFTGKRNGGRVRLDHPIEGMKYTCERGNPHLFIPRGIPSEWLADTTIPIIFVEAEKSALAIWALAQRKGLRLIPIAIGGCWGWLRTRGRRPMPNGSSAQETGPSPDFDLVAWEGRLTTIAFDSNASTNPDVRKARRTFSQELAARGASILIADVPTETGINGPDDLIAAAGDNAMLIVLDTARPSADCAAAEADQAIVALEADKKSDPLLVIQAIAAVEDPERRALLIGRLAILKVPGTNRKFIEQQVSKHRAGAEANRNNAVEAARRGRLMAMDVEAATLLDEVSAFIRRFVSLVNAEALVLALWIVHTHTVAAAECTPYLSITSAEKQSGKSRLLEVLEKVVANPWYTGRVTAAVLYRKIDAEAPTLLLDESDAAFRSGEEYAEALRGILNTGHRRGGKATCCVGQGGALSYQDFSTFSPKAIAGIGKLPDTVADRSIPIRLKRKARGETVERFRPRKVRTESGQLRERLEAWGAQNVERLRELTPGLPEELSDRQQDGSEPLLAIADLAGSEWPEAARRALVSLCCGAQAVNDSMGTQLLSDIQQIFKSQDTDRLPSTELTGALAEIETSPWIEWNHGKAITPPALARLLRPFGITPHNIRIAEKTPKGYETADFQDAWVRYLPNTVVAPSYAEAATPPQVNTGPGSSDFANRHKDGDVAAQQCGKPNKNAACGGVALSEAYVRTEEDL